MVIGLDVMTYVSDYRFNMNTGTINVFKSDFELDLTLIKYANMCTYSDHKIKKLFQKII